LPRYSIEKRLIAIGSDYVVRDGDGGTALRVDGKVRFATTFDVLSADGERLIRAREKLLSIDRLFLLRRDGAEIGKVRRTSTGDAPHVFSIDLPGELPIRASGSFFPNQSVRFEREGSLMGRLELVPRQAFGETFLFDIGARADLATMVAVAMCITSTITYRGESAKLE